MHTNKPIIVFHVEYADTNRGDAASDPQRAAKINRENEEVAPPARVSQAVSKVAFDESSLGG